MTRERPSRHPRLMRVGKGRKFRKRVIINPHIIRRNVRIKKREYKTLRDLTKRDFELGGFLDFNKQGLERVILFHGQPSFIDIPDEDFEVEWHTHPGQKGIFRKEKPPEGFSIEDLDEFLTQDRQSMVIFQYGRDTLILSKVDKSKRLPIAKLNELKKQLTVFYDKLDNSTSTERTRSIYNKELGPFLRNKLGVEIKIVPRDKVSASFPIRVIET